MCLRPAGRGRPVLRDTRHVMVEFWQALCPARPQDEAETLPGVCLPIHFRRGLARARDGCQKSANG